MKLKYVAASKLLLSNWSIPKLDRVLEQTDIRLSRSLDFVSPNNIKVSCVQMALHNELPAKDALEMVLGSVNRAVSDGSQLIVFPEYVGLLPLLSSSSLFDLCYQSPRTCSTVTPNRSKKLSPSTPNIWHSRCMKAISASSRCLVIKASVYILAGTTVVRTREAWSTAPFCLTRTAPSSCSRTSCTSPHRKSCVASSPARSFRRCRPSSAASRF